MSRCDCAPASNPTVIGACACPIHGMKALREAVDAALIWIESVTHWVGPGVPEDRADVISQLNAALNE